MTVGKGKQKQRIGILGGTFDPPHLGHLLLAETAREELDLAQVLFMPAGQPPHKADGTISPESHRLAMVELAIAGNPYFAVDTTDLKRPPPHFTATLHPLLQKKYPEAELWLLIGGDSLRDLPLWHKPMRVVAEWKLGVLPRPEATIDWPVLEQQVPGVYGATVILDGPTLDVSSTQIRHWIAQGRWLRYIFPDSVRDYARAHALYAGRRQESVLSSESAVSGGTA